ncbi:hypothetical protein GW17_00061928 [Ensete ventricosum]|nr:hypothetical protein GW17_00061928 [Ensete ventricosum]
MEVEIKKERSSLEDAKVGEVARQPEDLIVLGLGHGDEDTKQSNGEDQEHSGRSSRLPPGERDPGLGPERLLGRRRVVGSHLLVADDRYPQWRRHGDENYRQRRAGSIQGPAAAS